MSKIIKETEVLKELSEVGDFVVGVIDAIKNKKPIAEVMPELLKALEGIGELPAEVKDTPALVETSFYIANNIVQLFLPTETPAEVATKAVDVAEPAEEVAADTDEVKATEE